MNLPEMSENSKAIQREFKAMTDAEARDERSYHHHTPKDVSTGLREHLLAIARCPIFAATLNGDTTPCSKVIGFQTERCSAPVQLPTPWLGRLDEAPILFIGANPSIGFNEEYPRWDADDEVIVDAFQFAFESSRVWVKDGNKQLQADGTHSRAVAFWSQVKSRAREILDRDPTPGVDYAITEIVRCRSQTETGVREALDECTGRWLDDTLRLSPARVIVILGRNAARAFAGKYGVQDKGLFEANIAGTQRMIVCLPHPAAWGPKTIVATLGDSAPPKIREYLAGFDRG